LFNMSGGAPTFLRSSLTKLHMSCALKATTKLIGTVTARIKKTQRNLIANISIIIFFFKV
jgi:hypothetical protein